MDKEEIKTLVGAVVKQVSDEWLPLGPHMGVKRFGQRTHLTLQQTFPGLEGVMTLRVEELQVLGDFITQYLKVASSDKACQMKPEDVTRNEKNGSAGANQQGPAR